jgi:6-phosphofructokinase 1
MKVIGIRRGWDGLVAYSPDAPGGEAENLQLLTPAGVRTIDRSGGTILHTSRTNPSALGHKDAPPSLKSSYSSPSEKKTLPNMC